MNNRELSEDLKQRAINLGLCSEWQKEWTTEDKDELCDMYVRGIDFCIVNNYPTTEYMKRNFEGVMQKHGIYVDEKVNIDRPKLRTYVINGRSDAVLNLEGFDLCEVYVRHNSKLRVSVKGNARVFICLFDNAKAEVTTKGSLSNAIVYRYGDEVVVSQKGDNVKIRKGEMK